MRVLISGGGIAGPNLAYWLRQGGADVTVVERAPAPRAGGQAVDVRGVALDVIERMGLIEEVRKQRTRMRGSSMIGPDGTELSRSTEYAPSSGRLDSEDIEILRDDLVTLLSEKSGQIVHGNAIVAMRQDDTGVDVAFRNNTEARYDLVIGADGLNSKVRRLAFTEQSDQILHLGAYVAVYTAANTLGLDEWQVWLQGENAGAGIYTARNNRELRVNIGFMSGPLEYDRNDLDAQRRMVQERTAALGWEIPRLLEAMWTAPDFYFDAMAQVRLDSWSTGRVALVGDAGYCASPLSGQGTSLALVGGYVLAEELTKADADHRAAFAAYEERMRPFVVANQALATENPGGPASEESIEKAKHAITL
ncbi:MAG TPA: FAD-dependent monooxygenase [Dactylosporangium sp.]|jgi:2-polyprenyl-6-methoxyphenol hydroxylase-like FAD-dependent oxidoreductase|nr:FAD-dependent monooxygenase [Dactylosporangium sp.]